MAKQKYDYKTKTISLKLYDGTIKRLKLRAKTQKELDAKVARALIEYEMGQLAFNSKTTVARWVEEWSEAYAKPAWSEHDYKQFMGIINRYFLPEIGRISFCDLRPIHLQKCVSAFNGMSASQISKAKIAIGSVLKKAAANNLIGKDLSKEIVWSGGETSPKRALNLIEREIFTEAIYEHPRGLFFALMYGCGLRAQEARALMWSDIDFEKCEMHVRRAIKRSTGKPGPPKSSAGVRNIPIPPWLMDMLSSTQKTGLFVIANAAGSYISKDRSRRAWASFKRLMYIKAGVPTYRNELDADMAAKTTIHELTPHYLRHTYATMLAENGVDMKTAQYLLGHATIQMTAKIYTHVTPKMIDMVRDKINTMHDEQMGIKAPGTTMGQIK